MTEKMAPGLEVEAIRRIIEESDNEALVSFCADDAELGIVNKDSSVGSRWRPGKSKH